MKPIFEKVIVPDGASWTLFDRRLEAFPFEWHYHPEFELTLTLNSRGQRYIGDHIDTYDDGDLVLIGPNLPHTWCSQERIDSSAPHRALVLWFSRDWASQILGPCRELGPVVRLLGEADRGIAFSGGIARTAAGRIQSLVDRDAAGRLIGLLEVLALLATDDTRARLSSPAMVPEVVVSADQERIGRVLSHIHANYREPTRVQDLADLALVSVSSFHRLFRRHTHMTLTEYVARLRIGQACSMLINTDKTIAFIADEVGYRNLANFNRQFRALKGVTPRAFRESFRQRYIRTGQGAGRTVSARTGTG